MRFLVYVSRSKVDMLYPQIPQRFFKSFEAELKLNLGLVSTGGKGTTNQRSEELTAKLNVVSSYILEHEPVGTLQMPKKYISGSLPLKYGVVREYASDVAFFGGEFEGTTLAMIGSSDSLVGSAQHTDVNHSPFYYTLKFLNQQIESDSPSTDQPPYCTYKEAADIALSNVTPVAHALEFLALVLHHEVKLVVATPIYIALAQDGFEEELSRQGSRAGTE